MQKLEDQTTKDPLYEVPKRTDSVPCWFARHDDSRGEADLPIRNRSLERDRAAAVARTRGFSRRRSQTLASFARSRCGGSAAVGAGLRSRARRARFGGGWGG